MDNRGLEKLDQWLLKYGNDDSILSASELDGFFAAIVSAPRQVAPAIWYSAIWADQPPQWPSDKDGERFMKLAVELMSEAAYMLAEEPDDYEAIFLADKIFLMTNGPGAVLAEIVENPLPKERGRIDLHRHPYYYALRNHIVDFLVSRSKSFAAEVTGHDPRHVPTVRPGLGEPVIVSPPRVVEPNPAQSIAR